jgi:hypothetical protein
LSVLRAILAALGGYYFSAAAVLVLLTPVRYSLPRFGDLYYDPIVTILTLMTAVGVFVAAVISYSRGGVVAFSIVAILAAIAAASTILPFVPAGPAAWIPPSDLSGPTPATAIALSWLPAAPALFVGAIIAARIGPRLAGAFALLEAAGAYYLTAVAMSLPIPQLDLRLTLPFAATYLPAIWHAAVLAVPAIACGLVFPAEVPLRKTALLGGLIGLAGAAPGEIPPLFDLPGAYWPVSLVVVPLVTAAVAVLAIVGRRALAARSRPAFVFASNPAAAAVLGAAVTVVAVGAWTLLATMPNSSDRSGPVESYARTGDERKIVACVTSGRGEELLGSSAREQQDVVTVSVRLRRSPSWYFHDLAGIALPVVISLRDPLGGRVVMDEWSGGVVSEAVRTERTGFGFGC